MEGDASYADALTHGRVRGRGAGLNPGNRFERVRLHVLGEHLDACRDEEPTGRQVSTHTGRDRTRRLLNRVDSLDLNFHWTLNPYRGCEHGCVYCYARPTHEMLGYSCGLDFETQIVAKPDAPDLLRRELASRRWTGEPIAMSGVTDAYQPVEAELKITRHCLEIMAECRQPVGIVTKRRLVTRDIDLLSELARHDATVVGVSVTTLNGALARSMEPRASSPRDRLRAIRELSSAGVPVLAMVAPIVPGLNDHEIPRILRAVSAAGATAATWVMLRLPEQVKALFIEWLHREWPLRARAVESAIRAVRGGRLNDPRFGSRMRGEGPRADQIDATFKVFAKRYGIDRPPTPLSSAAFRRPALDGQMELFEDA